jgi:prepilin-type N-terminal cleavage/methylation domain-containing protein
MKSHTSGRSDKGFTLVEILIAIVVVGILAAVVVVGISSLTSKGNATACTASRDAAVSGATVYFTNEGKYPAHLYDLTQPMTGGVAAALTLPSNVNVASGADVTTGATWTLTMTPKGDTTPPVFVCS